MFFWFFFGGGVLAEGEGVSLGAQVVPKSGDRDVSLHGAYWHIGWFKKKKV